MSKGEGERRQEDAMGIVLTRSEGQEEACIVIEPEGECVKVWSLIAPAPQAIDRKRFKVNGKIYRAKNTATPWGYEEGPIEGAVETYRQSEQAEHEWEESSLIGQVEEL